jgi:hypothetical protein
VRSAISLSSSVGISSRTTRWLQNSWLEMLWRAAMVGANL